MIVHASGIDSNAKTFTVSLGSFNSTGSLTTARDSHSAVMLTNGTVIMAAGSGTNPGTSGFFLSSAELYNPTAATFSPTGSLIDGRDGQTATLLANGSVLVAGGQDVTFAITAKAEVYNPTVGTFTSTGSMTTPRFAAAAVVLDNGQVLICGGKDNSNNILATAEIYNPATGTFTPTGSLATARLRHTATLLNTGMVLIVGGDTGNGSSFIAQAELYNPATGTFSTTGSLGTPVEAHTATVLNNGTVLIAGGESAGGNVTTAQIYDPTAGTFSPTGSMLSARSSHVAALLNNGTVLVAGGAPNTGASAQTSAEVYDPVSATFLSAGNMSVGHEQASATLLPNGSVLIAGGMNPSTGGPIANADVYQPASFAPPNLVSIAITPTNPSIIVNASQVLTAIATFADNSTQTLSSATWTSSSNAIATVTNDATNHAQVFAVGAGSATISACVGTICGTATTGIVPPPTPTISAVTPPFAPVGTPVTITGTNFGTSQTGVNVTFNGVQAPISAWSPTSISTTVPTGATTGSLEVIVTFQGQPLPSSAFNFGVSPNITGFNPLAGPIANPVTISGTSFGQSQGNSTITFNGVAATPTSWTDSGIVVPVPSGATTGPLVITVATFASNSPNFQVTVAVPPTITATLSPAPNASGWNNSDVTLSYTCTPGALAIVSCQSPQIISTEGAGQIVTGTVTDSAGDVISTSVTINLDKTIPTLDVTSPLDGSSSDAGSVIVSGSTSDSLSGSSTTTCNGNPATMSSGSFSCSVVLSQHGPNLVRVRAFDNAGNVAGANFHVGFNGGQFRIPTSIQITPGAVNMLVGDTQQFNAIDQNGLERIDASWTVSDTSLATITGDSSPVLTALAIGQVTLTATVDSVSAQVQVNILGGTVLPDGTVGWSVIPMNINGVNGALSSVLQLSNVQDGPDIFEIEKAVDSQGDSAAITGRWFTADGRQTSVPFNIISGGSVTAYQGVAAGDAFGGVVVYFKSFNGCAPGSSEITDYDGPSGALKWNTFIQYDCMHPAVAVGPNGNIYVIANNGTSLVTLDGNTGAQIGRWDVPATLTNPGQGDPNFAVGQISPPAVGPDGTVFALVDKSFDIVAEHDQVWLLSISPGGAASTATISIGGTAAFAAQAVVVPDGQGSAYAAWTDISNLTHISHGAADSVVAIGVPEEMVTDDTGILYVSSITGSTSGAITALSQMSPLWTFSGTQDLHLVGAVFGGGAIGLDQTGLVSISLAGQATAVSPSAFSSPLVPFGPSLVSPLGIGNWLGALNGSVAMVKEPSKSPGDTSGVTYLDPVFAPSSFPMQAGGLGNSKGTPKIQIATFLPTAPAANAPNDPRFGTGDKARKDVQNAIPAVSVDDKIYTDTTGVPPIAYLPNFMAETRRQLDVLGFVGHGVYITSTPDFAAGMLFFGDINNQVNQLMRTPNPNIPALNYQIANPEGTQLVDPLRTSAKVIFAAACDTGPVFTMWWDMNENLSPGGRALVVADFATMAQINSGNGILPANALKVDLVQGAWAWEKMNSTLAAGGTLQNAVTAANQEVAAHYGQLIYAPDPRLPQLSLKIVGNSNICFRNCPH